MKAWYLTTTILPFRSRKVVNQGPVAAVKSFSLSNCVILGVDPVRMFTRSSFFFPPYWQSSFSRLLESYCEEYSRQGLTLMLIRVHSVVRSLVSSIIWGFRAVNFLLI